MLEFPLTNCIIKLLNFGLIGKMNALFSPDFLIELKMQEELFHLSHFASIYHLIQTSLHLLRSVKLLNMQILLPLMYHHCN